MSETEARIEQWSEAIYAAHRDRVQIPGPSGSIGELSVHDAYEVQARVGAKRVAAGGETAPRTGPPGVDSAAGLCVWHLTASAPLPAIASI